MTPRADPNLLQANLRLARADNALVSFQLHMDRSVEACA
jgi:hypothetical protein